MSEDGKLYQAAYDFQAEDDSELSMKKGDSIRVTETTDPNWWSGKLTIENINIFSVYSITTIFFSRINFSRERKDWKMWFGAMSISDRA
jgi:hypothetical protein